jgi:uncharacterized protein (DUF983 family)
MPVERADGRPQRDVWRAMLDGFRGRCPACGTGRLFGRYLKVQDACAHCGEELHHHRADDAPPYFTIMIVGHVVVGAVLPVERAFAPPLWAHAALWLPLTLALSLWLLPRIKGAIVGLQWAFYMHGFEPTVEAHDGAPHAGGEQHPNHLAPASTQG